MTGPIEPVDDSQLEEAIEHLLQAKADRAANGANPFELVLAQGIDRRARRRRGVLAIAGSGVLVVGLVLVGIELTSLLRSQPSVASAPSPTPSATGIEALRRPLEMPVLAADGSCPVTPVGLTLESLGAFQGSGPVRVNNLNDIAVNELPLHDGWYGQKVFWAVDARESGPILVRAVRLDGTGGISLGAGFGSELVLGNDSLSSGGAVVGPSPAYPIERVFVDSVWFREAGCYLLQMDGPATSSTAVFRALAAPLLSATAAAAAAIANAGLGASVVSTTLSTYGAEACDGTMAAPGTLVWAVHLSGSFAFSCGPATTTPQSCPPPATTELILIDAETGAFIEGMQPAPEPTVTEPLESPAR